MKYAVIGTVMPVVKINLNNGERLYAQTGAMKWMDSNILMEPKFPAKLA